MSTARAAEKAIIDVNNQSEREEESSKRITSPYIALLTRNSIRRWKAKHEKSINEKIVKMKTERRKYFKNMNSFPDNRVVPLDVLAREWLSDNPVTIDARIYLIENLFPCLIMGLEKLLTEAEKRELVPIQSTVPNFNPLNYLAQYLMRNNPKYSNFPEASPYAKGLRKVAEDLKAEIFEIDSNRLAILKASAQVKRMEREKMERMKGEEQARRAQLLEGIFVTWAQNEGTVPLTLVQNALSSFRERSNSLSEEMRREAYFAIEPQKLDDTGTIVALDDFKELLGTCTISLSNGTFEKFLEHFEQCAHDYQQAADRVSIRYALKALFLACDHDAIGVLDRKCVLEILGKYYDGATAQVVSTLRNPRKWPVLEIEECEEYVLPVPVEENTAPEETEEAASEEVKPTLTTAQEIENRRIEILNKDAATVTEYMKTQALNDSDQKDGQLKQDDKSVNEGKSRVNSTDEKLAESKEEIVKSGEKNVSGETEAVDAKETSSKSESEDEASPAPPAVVPECTESVTAGSTFDKNFLNQTQFVNLCEKFLGDETLTSVLDSLVRFIKASYSETDEERIERQTKAREEARLSKRKHMVEQLFDFWDVDKSGTLNFQEVIEVLSKWKDIYAQPEFQEFMALNYTDTKEVTSSELHDYIHSVCTSCFPDEDPFEAIVIFLHTSIERTFEERKRGEARKLWLTEIDHASRTSAGMVESVYQATFRALFNDARAHGREKIISANIAMLESNVDPENLHRGDTVLRYVAATFNDIPFVLKKVLYRDMKCISFAVVDSGKPIHVTKMTSNAGVHLWNPARKELGTSGSLIVLPLKDHEKRVNGVLSVDTLDDPSDKSVFITNEIRFYQGVTKVLSQALQFVDVCSKTVKIADSALSWIHRKIGGVNNSVFYLVEPGLQPADGLVLRRMFKIDYNRKREYFEDPPRMKSNDNLFRDYLFKCMESSETITADAYGERHLAFPIRNSENVAIAIADISIANVRALPTHEMNEIEKMLRLLAVAHREVANEVAGMKKNIVLEVEKQSEDFRIEVMFDRLMLTDLRESVSRLDNRAFAEIKSYKDPPKLIHDILKTVLGIFAIEEEKLDSWSTCKQFINADLIKMVTQYDPTSATSIRMVDAQKLSENIEGISHGTVFKQTSLPAQYLFNWAFVCLSLIEHTAKMQSNIRLKKMLKDAAHASTPSEDSELTAEEMLPNLPAAAPRLQK